MTWAGARERWSTLSPAEHAAAMLAAGQMMRMGLSAVWPASSSSRDAAVSTKPNDELTDRARPALFFFALERGGGAFENAAIVPRAPLARLKDAYFSAP